MRRVLLGLLLISLIPVSVVTADTNTIGVGDSLSSSTRQIYSDYVYNYNKIKEKVVPYELNILLNTTDHYEFWAGDYPEDVTEEELAEHTTPLGKYDLETLRSYLNVSEERKAQFNTEGYKSDNDSLTPDEELYLSEVNIEYYYDYNNNQLIQKIILSKMTDEFYKEKWLYYVYSSEGQVLTYEETDWE